MWATGPGKKPKHGNAARRPAHERGCRRNPVPWYSLSNVQDTFYKEGVSGQLTERGTRNGEKVWRYLCGWALPGDALALRLVDKATPQEVPGHRTEVVTKPDGAWQWIVEGRPWSGVGWSGLGWGKVSCYARAGVAEEPEPGIFRAANAKYRCEDMDRDGVDAELVNGPYEQIAAIKDAELRTACVQVVNDWARELYEESNGRFIMLLPLPCQTPEEAVAELLRVAASACRLVSSSTGRMRRNRCCTRCGSRCGRQRRRHACQ